jgi:glycosyltransferase involved in cell wall biosynthesis
MGKLAGLPKVTVITIVLNAADVIERTLKSVIAQDYPYLEYLVVDGKSTDGTLELVQQYRHGITTLVSEKDGGVYQAMNKGADMASGEFILYMNGGDVFVAPDAITRTFAACDWARCDVIYGDGVFTHEGRRLAGRAPDRVTLHDGNGFSHQSTFMRATLQKEYGFDVTERVAADYDLFLRLYKAGKVFRRVDVVVSEFFTGGLSTLPEAETIRLRHRVYKKHLPRSDMVLHFRLARLAAKTVVRALVPTRAWEGLKNFRDRRKVLQQS